MSGKAFILNETPMGRAARVEFIAAKLKAEHGHDAALPIAFDTPGRVMTGPKSEPLDGLIETILSQQSTVQMTQRMADALRSAFSDWGLALAAGRDGIQVVLAAARGNLAATKAGYIYGVLARLAAEKRALSLHFLRDWPVAEARIYLRSFKGVGAKTANCVLLFNLRLPVQPIDTHLHRIACRLGLVDEIASPESVGEALESLIPSRWQDHYEFHLNGIEHGQQTCKARHPRCEVCVVRTHCPQVGVKDALATA